MSSSPSTTRVPKYVRLAETIREQVRTGVLKPGDQLPSYAQFQAQHGVAQATLDRVYALLEKEKIIVRTPKQGTFVLEPPKTKRTNVVGVLAGLHPREHSYYMRLLQGVQQVASEKDVPMLLLKETHIDWSMLDGVVLAGVEVTVPFEKPSVSLMQDYNRIGFPCVGTDDYGGMLALTRHLLELGHRNISFLTVAVQTKPDTVGCQRLNGYRDALSEAGIEYNRNLVRPLFDPLEKYGELSQIGYNKMRRWLDEGWRELGSTAVLAQNDEVAIGIMRALYEAGISVPEQVSVAGFDGLELGLQLRPSLTTVEVPLAEIGAEGARFLFEEMDAAESGKALRKSEKRVVPTALRLGESTAPPPR